MRRLRETAMAAALERLFAASYEQADLPSALQDLADAAGAEGCILIQQDASGFGCLGSPNIAEPVDVFAKGGWVDRNYRFERGMPLAEKGLLITESMLCSSTELDREPLQNEFLDRYGMRWWAGVRIAKDEDSSMFLSIERTRRSEPFDGADYASLQRSLPFLKSAGATALTLGRAFERGMLEGLEHVRRPAILLDGFARPVAMNDSAAGVFDSVFQLTDHRLRAASPVSDAVLQRALAALLGSGAPHHAPPPPVRLFRRDRSSAWARFAPVAGPLAWTVKRPRVLLTLQSDSTERDAKTAVLRHAYALTPSEVRVALALAEGLEVREIADLQKVSVATVRTHVKAIFLKTETRRQIEVALLVNRIE